jgi:predicted lysophospholipase L1 biosynthesis ABC-type transport system permease subunit
MGYGKAAEVVRSQGAPIVSGVAFGIGGAAVSTRYLTSLLHEVTPLDPLTFIVAAGLVTLAALVAVVIPAMRARSVDPTVLMRAQ